MYNEVKKDEGVNMKTVLNKIICLTLVLFTLFASKTLVFAEGKQYEHLYEEISREKTSITEGIDWTKIILNTKTTRPAGSVAGYGSTGEVDVNTWYGQQVNLLEVPRLQMANGDQKFELVVWSIQGDEQWDFASVTKMAEDFERKNPDYMVLGGINGDFYDWHTTKDYPNSGNGIEVQNGEVIRTLISTWGMVGFRNNNSADQLVYDWEPSYSQFSSAFYLTVYDKDGNEVESIQLDGMNMSSLSDGQTSAYFGNLERVYLYDEHGNTIPNSYGDPTIKERVYHAPVLADGDSYFVINGSKVIYQAAENSYYGKGVITNSNDETEVVNNSFAIVTKNEHVKELLAVGSEIRVQRQLVGDFADIKNAIGCYITLADNGVFPAYSTDSYLTIRAPRTIVGCKADGTVCLLTMDGRQPNKDFYGTNQEEINTILEQLEITEAYLLDGGGSSTFFVRENDKFIVTNSPSDGHVRSVSNGILIVSKKDESVKVSNIESTTNKVELTVQEEVENITNVYFKFNDQMLPFVDGKLVLESLTPDTEYKGVLYYQVEGANLVPTSSMVNFMTDKITPTVEVGEFTFDDKFIYPNLIVNDPNGAISLIIVKIGGKRVVYTLNPEPDAEPVKIARPSGSNYDCDITITYKLNEAKSKVEYTIKHTGSFEIQDIPDDPVIPDVPTHNHVVCPTCGKCTSIECPGLETEKCMGHVEDDKKKGCGSGAYIVSALLPIGLAFVFLKRKNH